MILHKFGLNLTFTDLDFYMPKFPKCSWKLRESLLNNFIQKSQWAFEPSSNLFWLGEV